MAKKKAKTGRLPKLTEEVAKVLVDNVTAGVPRKHAAQRAGVTDRTVQRWLAAGRKAKSGPLVSLLSSLKKAESDCIARNVANVQRAASEREEVTTKETRFPDGTVKTEKTVRKVIDWCAAAWYLERTCPEDFSLNRKEIRQMIKDVANMGAQLKELEEQHAADERAQSRTQADRQPVPIIPKVGGHADPNAI